MAKIVEAVQHLAGLEAESADDPDLGAKVRGYLTGEDRRLKNDVVEDVLHLVRDGADQVRKDAKGSQLSEFVARGALPVATAVGMEAQPQIGAQFLEDRDSNGFFLRREVRREDK